MSKPVLSIEGLSLSFGGLKAVADLSLSVERGTIYAIIGPNGAGKTTVFNIVSGLYRADEGSVLFNGTELTALQPHEVTACGVGRTFQNLELFGRLSVLENLLIARHLTVKTGFWQEIFFGPKVKEEEARARSAAIAVLDRLGLAEHANTPIREFPYPIQKRVELARALALDPKILLLDEPAAGLNSVDTRELSGVITRIRDELGITIVLVEHDMSMVMQISDRILVLDHGQKIAFGPPKAIQNDPTVIEAYLGRGSAHAVG